VRRLSGLELLARAVRSIWGVPALIALTALTLLPMKGAGFETSTAFLPPPRVLLAYGLFFAFGWLLFLRRELLPVLAGRAGLAVAGAVVAAAGYLCWGLVVPPGSSGVTRLLGIGLAASATWLFVLGLCGLFLRRFDHPSRPGRWLADGAYWIYLVHLPFVIWVSGLLASRSWPALAKFAVVVAATAAATTGSYWLFVRSTWIGQALNGRRQARGLPPVGPARSAGTRLPGD
jgi:peptidoglycan/LPS O-acetylase OafA/YrhL